MASFVHSPSMVQTAGLRALPLQYTLAGLSTRLAAARCCISGEGIPDILACMPVWRLLCFGQGRREGHANASDFD
jgi:hypothetical protein